MRNLQVKQLTADRLQQAYPLLQNCDPALSLESWQAFAGALVAESQGSGALPSESGIISVENEQGYITALFTYRCSEDLYLGRLLTAENFIAFDFLDPRACAKALIEAMEHLCRQLSCQGVRSFLSPAAKGDRRAELMAALLKEQGHQEGGRVFFKKLAKKACLKS